MIHISQNNIKNILETDLQNGVCIIEDFLDEKFACELYDYILWLHMERTNSLKSDRSLFLKKN